MLQVNEYFQGLVKSIAFNTGESSATVGVMAPGEYQFSTSEAEAMSVVSGTLTVKLPGTEHWQVFPAGASFKVDARQTFSLRVAIDTAYLCVYGEGQ